MRTGRIHESARAKISMSTWWCRRNSKYQYRKFVKPTAEKARARPTPMPKIKNIAAACDSANSASDMVCMVGRLVSFVVNAESVWWYQKQRIEKLAVSPLRSLHLPTTTQEHIGI